MGLESVSRGATKAVLVDKGEEALELCRLNTEKLGFTEQVEIMAMTVSKALLRLRGQQFNLVFSDPPYQQQAALEVLTKLPSVMSEGGVAVIEYGKLERVPDAVGPMQREDERSFGETVVSIFRLTSSAS